MNELSDDPFNNLLVQIRVYSPNCVPLLHTLRAECGRQTAFYAAFVFIVLNASTEKPHDKPLETFTAADFQDFAFFEVAKENPQALALFDQLLETYKQDRVTAQR